jgi:hypothetical protein
MDELMKVCSLCEGSLQIGFGPDKGERCDYCIDGYCLTTNGEVFAMLIKRYVFEPESSC